MGNLQKSREALADRIAPSILRFHILANSDSREDQAVKLEVRSFLLDYIQDRLPEYVDNKEAIITWLSENKCNLETAATRFLTKKQMPYPRACLWSKPGFPPGSMTTWSSLAASTTPPGSSLEKETATTGGASSTRVSAFSMKSAKRFPKKSRRELQDKLNQGDYPLLEDHRPDIKIRFFFFPELQPVLPSHSSG